MPQYKVTEDPQIDGVQVGDVLSSDGTTPYTSDSNLDVYIAIDFVETMRCFFQRL